MAGVDAPLHRWWMFVHQDRVTSLALNGRLVVIDCHGLVIVRSDAESAGGGRWRPVADGGRFEAAAAAVWRLSPLPQRHHIHRLHNGTTRTQCQWVVSMEPFMVWQLGRVAAARSGDGTRWALINRLSRHRCNWEQDAR